MNAREGAGENPTFNLWWPHWHQRQWKKNQQQPKALVCKHIRLTKTIKSCVEVELKHHQPAGVADRAKRCQQIDLLPRRRRKKEPERLLLSWHQHFGKFWLCLTVAARLLLLLFMSVLLYCFEHRHRLRCSYCSRRAFLMLRLLHHRCLERQKTACMIHTMVGGGSEVGVCRKLSYHFSTCLFPEFCMIANKWGRGEKGDKKGQKH